MRRPHSHALLLRCFRAAEECWGQRALGMVGMSSFERLTKSRSQGTARVASPRPSADRALRDRCNHAPIARGAILFCGLSGHDLWSASRSGVKRGGEGGVQEKGAAHSSPQEGAAYFSWVSWGLITLRGRAPSHNACASIGLKTASSAGLLFIVLRRFSECLMAPRRGEVPAYRGQGLHLIICCT